MKLLWVLFFILFVFMVYADTSDDPIYGLYVNSKFDLTLNITQSYFTADYVSHSDPTTYYYSWLDGCMVCLVSGDILLKVMVVRVREKLYAFVYENDQVCYILERVKPDKIVKE
jgi:hypothetical protein